VARCLKQALEEDRLGSTLDLRKAVVRAVGPQRVGGIDPATKTFQALRIAVNGELDQLDRLLDALPSIIAPGGIAAFISFHSLEDRKVKQAFLDGTRFERLTKKPVVPSNTELDENPRSRSAKLRAARLLRPDWASGERPPSLVESEDMDDAPDSSDSPDSGALDPGGDAG
jgi:16S rRNA (cytosine1402-N4)-methyltransferase